MTRLVLLRTTAALLAILATLSAFALDLPEAKPKFALVGSKLLVTIQDLDPQGNETLYRRFVGENPAVAAYFEESPDKLKGKPTALEGKWVYDSGKATYTANLGQDYKTIFVAIKKSAVVKYVWDEDDFRLALAQKVPAGINTDDYTFRAALQAGTVSIDLSDSELNFGGAFKDGVGRLSFAGRYTSETGRNKGESALFRNLSIRYGATYYTSGGIVGDSRGDQSATDAAELSYASSTYRSGGRLTKFGLRARMDAKFKGWESTLYWAPFVAQSQNNRFLVASEIEVGWRNMTEWKNPVTVSGIQANSFARIGVLVEWMPEIGAINSNMREGFLFYIRGRGWGDTFEKGGGGTGFRFRPFFDAELSLALNDDYRAFVRYENGFLPPDLSKATSRIYAGVGARF